jgi:hypothetical protein
LSVTLVFPNNNQLVTSPQEMAALTNNTFPVADRIQGIEGEGFDLLDWYAAALQSVSGEGEVQPLPAPTHLIVRAADEFQATIPWEQLSNALLQFAINGEPLVKAWPLRLYVPDGTSECLNVKCVVSLRFVTDNKLGDKAGYGFLKEISPIQMTKGLRSR